MDDCVTVVDQFDEFAIQESECTDLILVTLKAQHEGKVRFIPTRDIEKTYFMFKKMLTIKSDKVRDIMIGNVEMLNELIYHIKPLSVSIRLRSTCEAIEETSRRAIYMTKRLHESLYWRWINLIHK